MSQAEFSNCVAVVTGAAAGIGRSLALELVAETPEDQREGLQIVIADMRLDPANKVADQIRSLGAHATAFKCDITDEKQVIKMAAQVSEDFGRLNLLCNVAGVNVIAKLHETSAQDVEWLFAVNVFGACHMARHFVPLLQAAAAKEQVAQVINVASGFGVAVPSMGPVQPSAYTGTKHAIVGLSDAMRKELAPDGIAVSVVCPGLVNTETWNSTSFRQPRFGGPQQGSPESKQRVKAWGQDPQETARLILAAVRRGDFYVLPLNEAGRGQMRIEIEARYAELLAAFDDDGVQTRT
jgi:NAD(P)-dependent dehydrogenase (short-subunit alcohol dehydrogenase family)